MNSEYVNFKKSEKKEIQRSFLNSQLLILDSLKRYRMFKQLKTEEFLLKIALKTKIDHLNNDLFQIERLLPKTTIHPQNVGLSLMTTEEKKDYTLEEEIDLIKRKLQALTN